MLWSALSHIQNSAYFCEQDEVFSHQNATRDEIITAVENALVSLYSEKPGESINNLRLKRFYEKKSSSNTSIKPTHHSSHICSHSIS